MFIINTYFIDFAFISCFMVRLILEALIKFSQRPRLRRLVSLYGHKWAITEEHNFNFA